LVIRRRLVVKGDAPFARNDDPLLRIVEAHGAAIDNENPMPRPGAPTVTGPKFQFLFFPLGHNSISVRSVDSLRRRLNPMRQHLNDARSVARWPGRMQFARACRSCLGAIAA